MTTEAASVRPLAGGDAMATSDWIVRLFRVSDLHLQQVILGLLNNVDELVAVGRLIGRDSYVAVETMEVEQAAAARQLILAIDPAARVLDTARRHPD
jgi:hypothetical protein